MDAGLTKAAHELFDAASDAADKARRLAIHNRMMQHGVDERAKDALALRSGIPEPIEVEVPLNMDKAACLAHAKQAFDNKMAVAREGGKVLKTREERAESAKRGHDVRREKRAERASTCRMAESDQWG